MSINAANSLIISLLIVSCIKYPRLGIVIILIFINCLPASFTYFGFAFGDGEKYLSNIIIIEVCYVVYYIAKGGYKLNDKLDLLIMGYLMISFIVTVLITSFSANIGVLLKRLLICPLFFFMGKVFVLESKDLELDCQYLNILFMIIGIYTVVWSLFEMAFQININALLLENFRQLVGSQVMQDPLSRIESELAAIFYRLSGTMVEPSESSLIMLVLMSILLSQSCKSFGVESIRKTLLILLGLLVIISSTRTSIIILLVMLIMYYLIRSTRLGRRSGLFVMVMINCSVLFSFLLFYYGADIAAYLDANIFDFMERLRDPENITSRLELVTEGISLWKENMWFGTGMGVSLYGQGMGDVYSMHNVYLDNLITQGILITVFLMIIIFMIVHRSLIAYKNSANQTIRQIAIVQLLLTVVMVIYQLSSPLKMQINGMNFFYAGMVSCILYEARAVA